MPCPCIPPEEARDNFANDFRDRYGDAGYYGPEAFDAANVLLAALGAGNATRADVLDYVNGYEENGVSPRIKFGPDGDLEAGDPHGWSYQVRGREVGKEQECPEG